MKGRIEHGAAVLGAKSEDDGLIIQTKWGLGRLGQGSRGVARGRVKNLFRVPGALKVGSAADADGICLVTFSLLLFQPHVPYSVA